MRISVERARGQMNELDGHASIIRQLKDAMAIIKTDLNATWDSKDHGDVGGSLENLIRRSTTLASTLYNLGVDIYYVAMEIRAEEEEAIRRAREEAERREKARIEAFLSSMGIDYKP